MVGGENAQKLAVRRDQADADEAACAPLPEQQVLGELVLDVVDRHEEAVRDGALAGAAQDRVAQSVLDRVPVPERYCLDLAGPPQQAQHGVAGAADRGQRAHQRIEEVLAGGRGGALSDQSDALLCGGRVHSRERVP